MISGGTEVKFSDVSGAKERDQFHEMGCYLKNKRYDEGVLLELCQMSMIDILAKFFTN